jgi:Protein of unknown function (DUF998)
VETSCEILAVKTKPQSQNVRPPMNTEVSVTDTATISVPAARVAIAATGAVLLLLASLHVLSPEFDPSWRVVSEYANGRYGWVLSLMFAFWALSSWALAVTVWSQVKGIDGKIAMGFLIAAGVGEAMASVFDINHPFHGLAGMIGVMSLPIAAMLISVRLGRTQAWSAAKNVLLWTANLTWVSLVLMVAALFIMIRGKTGAGHKMAHDAIEVVGWANRLLVVVYCLWVVTVARQALQLRGRPSRSM